MALLPPFPEIPLPARSLSPSRSRLARCPSPAGAGESPRPSDGRGWHEVTGEGCRRPSEGRWGKTLVPCFLKFRFRAWSCSPRGGQKKSNRHRCFVTQEQEFIPAEFAQRNRAPVGVEKLHLEHIGRQHLDDGADLARNQALGGLVVQQGDHIEQFDRPVLHGGFIARNK